MEDGNTTTWSDAQLQQINDEVRKAFEQEAVVASILPTYTPPTPRLEYVSDERHEYNLPDGTLRVREVGTQGFWKVTLLVDLSAQQMQDFPSVLETFQRCARNLARIEDYILLWGYARQTPAPSPLVARLRTPTPGLISPNDLDQIVTGTREFSIGLAETGGISLAAPGANPMHGNTVAPGGSIGLRIVSTITNAIGYLEAQFQYGPFACILGQSLYEAVHEPSLSMVMPVDRIEPMLRTKVRRSSSLGPNTGVVIALGSNPIDIAVGTQPKVEAIRITDQGRRIFRVYERFVLRVKAQADDMSSPAVYTFTVL